MIIIFLLLFKTKHLFLLYLKQPSLSILLIYYLKPIFFYLNFILSLIKYFLFIKIIILVLTIFKQHFVNVYSLIGLTIIFLIFIYISYFKILLLPFKVLIYKTVKKSNLLNYFNRYVFAT